MVVEHPRRAHILTLSNRRRQHAGDQRVTAILEGELNINEVLSRSSGDELHPVRIRRHPKRNPGIFRALAYEYDGIGFTKDGGLVRRRPPEEQIRFTDRCVALGLKVLPVVRHDNHSVESVFLPDAQNFDDYLMHATPEQANRVTYETFTDLMKAHRHGIVYGDRWAENILVVPELGFVHIDFDIEISGPHAKEFEAAQIAAYVVGGSKDAALPLLARLLTSPHARWDTRYVESFLRGHARFYDADHKYGPIDNELTTLEFLMRRERDART